MEQLLFGADSIDTVCLVGALSVKVVLGLACLGFILVAHHPVGRVVKVGALQLVEFARVFVEEGLVELGDVGFSEGSADTLVAPEFPLFIPIGDESA